MFVVQNFMTSLVEVAKEELLIVQDILIFSFSLLILEKGMVMMMVGMKMETFVIQEKDN
ncbi:MAG: hypothetical protein EPGJADBJ_02606 [Saprospiraceae bacterium]|nr:hypothetical protein [Saprospiraceae bacterium]